MSNVLSLLHRLFSTIHPSGWIGLFVIAVILLLKVIPAQSPIATVDVTGIVRQFVRSQAKLNLPPKALEQRVNRFGHQLEATLNRIAQERHLVLLPQEAVIAGVSDLTPLVKQRLETDAFLIPNKDLW